MKWKLWKIGAIVSLFLAIFTAGASQVDGWHWRAFAATFCAASLSIFGAYLKQHPIEDVSFDTTTIIRPVIPAPVNIGDPPKPPSGGASPI